jgi:archaeosine synthase
VARTVELLDGLALLGSAQVGPLGGPLPNLLYGEGKLPSTVDPDLAIRLESHGTMLPGRRRLLLRQGSEVYPLELPVPAAEITGVPGLATEVAPGGWSLHWPLSPPEWLIVANSRPALVILSNARALWADGEAFVQAVADVRRELGAAPLLWAPRTALPNRLPFLNWLSVDLTDTTEGLWRATEGKFLDPTLGELDPAAARAEHRCRCRECRNGDAGAPTGHALEMYGAELDLVRAAIRAHRLRELVELRQTSEAVLAEMLRYADRILADRLEERAPVVSTESRSYVLRESFRRPEVVRFRRRFLERYRSPISKQLLLLVPCSKTKPYRASRSHRRMEAAIGSPPAIGRLHLVSVTSPLGVVPRELEDVYPARHYDIPVTGEWDELERQAVRDGVQHLLRVGAYRSIVVHLDREEYGFLADLLPEDRRTRWTSIGGRTTGPESLQALHDAIAEALHPLDPVPGGPLSAVREELAELAAYQFGRPAAELLFRPPVRLHGRPWFQRLTDGSGVDLATWQETRGLFHLTVAGAARMQEAHPLDIEVDPAVRLEGDLFTPGVVRADRGIRVGDAVRLVQGEKLLAVGVADLPGPLMTELSRGCAVRIRHRARPTAAPLPTAT